ncbi:MAG: Mrp/NBP35 family ATP-binding protein [Thaumarchaeota archaeon]|nr:Mrp/NBP35 family ATP-binding protein [Nitrososphaerota archaeon]
MGGKSQAQHAGLRREELEEQEKKLREKMSRVKHKVAVISGKGGVGKTVVTVNLAIAFAKKCNPGKVGILDADIHGPCVPRMLGMKGGILRVSPLGAFPATGPLGIKVVSIDFLLPNQETPVIWRGPLKMSAIRQFLSDITWGELDLLLIDLPPGTGDEALSVMQLLPEMDGVIIVTIPSEVSKDVVRKAVTFARELNVPIIGLVENMSGLVCPKCGTRIDVFKSGGGEEMAREMNISFLGRIPLDPRVCEASDEGMPFIMSQEDLPAARSFAEIAEKVWGFLAEKSGVEMKTCSEHVRDTDKNVLRQEDDKEVDC